MLESIVPPHVCSDWHYVLYMTAWARDHQYISVLEVEVLKNQSGPGQHGYCITRGRTKVDQSSSSTV